MCRKRETALSIATSLVLTAATAPPALAIHPDTKCQRGTPKAIASCIKDTSEATVKCFKKTGAACPPSEKKIVAAQANVGALSSKKCPNDPVVAAAGYGPLTPGELVSRFQASCTRETDVLSTRAFGAGGAIFTAASSEDQKCLLTAARRAGLLLAKSLREVGRCAGRKCKLDKIDAALEERLDKTVEKIGKACTDLAALVGLDPDEFADAAAEQVATAAAAPCDPTDPTYCMFPLANDYFTLADTSSASGRRLAFALEATPADGGGTHVDPAAWNVLDGFSVGPMLLFDDQSIDLAATGTPPITDIATSIAPDSPVLLLDAETGERQLLWVERDQSAAVPAQRPIVVRVGRNLKNAHRYVVAVRELHDDQGALVPASPVFAAYRDRTPTTQLPAEARRAHMEEIFALLDAEGIAREDLYLAWDFTTQSTDSTAAKLLHMRDDAFTNVLGTDAPAFQVTSVDEPLDASTFRRVDGTFQSPLYLTDGGIPGSRLRLGPEGLPLNQGDFFTANFRCVIPYAATTGGGPPAVPARASLYGHGLLGSEGETGASHVRALASEHNFVICGTAWTGFADEDVPIVLTVLQDFSNFPKFIERQHQGILNFMVLGRLMLHPDGFASDPAFQVGGESVIDPSDLFYDGNSQGGILGGALAAVAQDIERFVLGVPGMNYSTLLHRSVDFDLFNQLLVNFYPNGLDRQAAISIAQIMWDQTDPNGHIRHTTADTYANTPPKKLLYHVAFGDHQVAPVTVEVAARSNGALIHQPALSGAKVVPEVTPYYDIAAIPAYPFDGSAMVIWDSGNPAPPIGNVPPSDIEPTDPEWADLTACAMAHGSDPHECPRRQPEARVQKSEFLKNGGAIVDVCSGGPCFAPMP